MKGHRFLKHVTASMVLLLLLGASARTLQPVQASSPVLADPRLGPHARDEAIHRGDRIAFTPARSAIVPRQAAPAAGGLSGRSAAPLGPQAVTYSGRLQREVFGFAPYWNLSQNANWNYGLLSTVAYFGLDVKADGNFDTTSSGWAGWNSQDLVNTINRAHQAGDRVVVVIKAFSNPTINQIVTTGAGQTAINNTINAITSKNLDGVNVDFEGSSSASYPNIQTGMSSFVANLSSQVHQHFAGSMVSVDTYSGSASWDGGFFNISALAPSVDALFVMAYDMSFSDLPGQAGPNAPLNGWTYNDTSAVAQYLAKAPASKVILGVPYYGYKWSTASTQPYARAGSGTSAVADTYTGILDDFSCAPQLSRGWDSTAASPWASWWSPASGDPCGGNHNSWRELYYDDASSLAQKYDLVNANNLRGTGMWALGYDGTSQDLWNVLAAKFISAAGYDITGVPQSWAVNQTQSFTVNVTNAGFQPWLASGTNPVRLSLHFATSGGGWPAEVRSGFKAWISDQRFALPADVAPGATVPVQVTVTAPPTTAPVVLEAEMVKEGQFWFNQWATRTVSVAPPTWIAGIDMSHAPRVWAANQTQSFDITVTNTGNQTWPSTGATPVDLGLHFALTGGGWPAQVASSLTAWKSDSRVALPADLAPGASVAVPVTLTAPPDAASSVLEAEMVKETQFWFGQWAPAAVRVSAPSWLAGVDMTAAPRTWQSGQSQTFTVKVVNTGNQTLLAGGTNPVRLGLHFSRAAGGWPKQVSSSLQAWLTDQRVSLPQDLAPGQTVSIAVTATAPATGSPPVLEAEMVREQAFWFPQWSPVSLTASPGAWFAGYDLTLAPRTWAANQSATFNLTVTNTGNQVWTAGGSAPVRIGLHFASGAGGWPAQSASSLRLWLTDRRFALPADLLPGQSVTLPVTITAPANGAAVTLEAEMVKEQQFWFEDWAPVAVGISP